MRDCRAFKPWRQAYNARDGGVTPRYASISIGPCRRDSSRAALRKPWGRWARSRRLFCTVGAPAEALQSAGFGRAACRGVWRAISTAVIADIAFCSRWFGLLRPRWAADKSTSVVFTTIFSAEKILRAELRAASSCSQLLCCLLHRSGSTRGWWSKSGCSGQHIGGFHHHIFSRKEHVTASKGEKIWA